MSVQTLLGDNDIPKIAATLRGQSACFNRLTTCRFDFWWFGEALSGACEFPEVSAAFDPPNQAPVQIFVEKIAHLEH